MPREKRDFRYYQTASMTQAFKSIKSGEDSAFIGVGSVGKSNFLRAMSDHNAMKIHLPNPDHYILVYVDAHLIQHGGKFIRNAGPVFAGYELFMSSLLETLKEMTRTKIWNYPANPDRTALLNILEEDYHNFRTNSKGDSYAGLRYFRNMCDSFVGVYEDIHLVFLIDEIERLFYYLPAYFFEQLRGVRDKFKRQLIFVTTSRYLMSELQIGYDTLEDKEIVEGFTDLFKGAEFTLNRLDEASAKSNIERYRKRYDYDTISGVLVELLWQASGGHAGLLRHSFKPAMTFTIPLDLSFENQLKEFCRFLVVHDDSGVLNECRTIYTSLTPEEQEMVIGHIQPTHPNFKRLLDSLEKKQLIYHYKGSFRWLPLFEAYIKAFHQSA